MAIESVGLPSPPREDELKTRAYIHEISLSSDEIPLYVSLVPRVNDPLCAKLLRETLKAVILSANLLDFFRGPIIKVLL
jgi:hypothetical protein